MAIAHKAAPAKKAAAKRAPAKKPAAQKLATKKAAAKKGGGGSFYDYVRSSPVQLESSSSKSPKTKPSSKIQPLGFESGSVFVAMSFRGDGMDDSFAAIRKACKSLKLVARRVDELNSSGVIILEIVHLIERAEFIVVDLTHERPNVYYELGYAHGVGNLPSNILLIAKDGTDLHFDIAALRVRYYKSIADLERLVKTSLTGMINSSRGLQD